MLWKSGRLPSYVLSKLYRLLKKEKRGLERRFWECYITESVGHKITILHIRLLDKTKSKIRELSSLARIQKTLLPAWFLNMKTVKRVKYIKQKNNQMIKQEKERKNWWYSHYRHNETFKCSEIWARFSISPKSMIRLVFVVTYIFYEFY